MSLISYDNAVIVRKQLTGCIVFSLENRIGQVKGIINGVINVDLIPGKDGKGKIQRHGPRQTGKLYAGAICKGG